MKETLNAIAPTSFIPHMLRYFDHPEVVAACIPPRPFMMVAPTQDEDMPREGVDELNSGCGPGLRITRTAGAIQGLPAGGRPSLSR